VDLAISSDPEEMAGVEFIGLFDCKMVLVASSAHPLAKKVDLSD
jgi:LysR family transcriptional regulator for metE and metH